MVLFALFVIVPLIEIALFIQLGSLIGLWGTLLTIILTAALGTFLVRQQGISTLTMLQQRVANQQDPTELIGEGVAILFSGALLLTPGFFTDAIGFALLIPSVRRSFLRAVTRRVLQMQAVHVRTAAQAAPMHGDAIDGEYEDITDAAPKGGEPSGWTRH